MPALPNVNHVIRFDCLQTISVDVTSMNRFFMSYAGAGATLGDLTTLANTVSSAWLTNIVPLTPNYVTLTGVRLTDLTTTSAPQVQIAAARVGTRAGTPLTAGVCAVIRQRLSRRYRGGHPRVYLAAGVGADQANGQQWTAAFQAAVASGWGAFITAIATTPPASIGALLAVNVSYFAGFHNVTMPSGRQRAVPTVRIVPVTDGVISYSVNPNIGSQRRRYDQA